MIGFQVKLEREMTRNLERLAEKGLFRSISHTAAAIRSTARRFITRSKRSAEPGEPVHTRKGRAKRGDSILYFVDRELDEGIVGFTHSVMGESMAAHEHGGRYMGGDFPARPTMQPALEANLMRFADETEYSIGE